MSRNQRLIFFAVLLLAAALRLSHLGDKSLWFDELLELKRLSQGPHMVGFHNRLDVHPPLRLYLNGIPYWTRVVITGRRHLGTEFELRLVPALFGVLSVALQVLLVKRWAPVSVALLAGLLLAINREHLQHSQDCRMYSAYVAFSLLTLLAADHLAQKLREPSAQGRLWLLSLAFAVATLCNLFNYYLAVCLFMVQALWLLTVRRPDSYGWRPVLVAALGCAALVMAIFSSETFRRLLESKKFEWTTPPSIGILVVKDALDQWFSSPHVGPYWHFLFNLLAVTLASLGIVALFKRDPVRGRLLLLLFGLPFLALSVLRFEQSFFPRYVLFLLPLTLGAQAMGLHVLYRRYGKTVGATVLGFLTVGALFNVGQEFRLEKQNWRDGIGTLPELQKGEKKLVVVTGPVAHSLPGWYYLHHAGFLSRLVMGEPEIRPPGHEFCYLQAWRGSQTILLIPCTTSEERLAELSAGCSRVYYLRSFADIRGPFPEPASDWVQQQGRLIKSWPAQFEWGEVRLWEAPAPTRKQRRHS